MKDEVKELLEHIELLDNTDYILHSDKAKALLDYITNLQEEIQKKEAMYDSLAVSYRLAQEENERLNNIIKEVRECLNKNRIYIAGERNLAFEIEQILDKGE